MSEVMSHNLKSDLFGTVSLDIMHALLTDPLRCYSSNFLGICCVINTML